MRKPSMSCLSLATLLVASPIVMPLAAQHGGHGGSSPASAPRRDTPQPSLPVLFPPQESEGEVALVVAPRWGGGKLTVVLLANTHSVDLAPIDLLRVIVLRVGGQALRPESATALTGHHARATVVFPLERSPASFALEIRGVPDVEVRTLAWPVPRGTPDPAGEAPDPAALDGSATTQPPLSDSPDRSREPAAGARAERASREGRSAS